MWKCSGNGSAAASSEKRDQLEVDELSGREERSERKSSRKINTMQGRRSVYEEDDDDDDDDICGRRCDRNCAAVAEKRRKAGGQQQLISYAGDPFPTLQLYDHLVYFFCNCAQRRC